MHGQKELTGSFLPHDACLRTLTDYIDRRGGLRWDTNHASGKYFWLNRGETTQPSKNKVLDFGGRHAIATQLRGSLLSRVLLEPPFVSDEGSDLCGNSFWKYATAGAGTASAPRETLPRD